MNAILNCAQLAVKSIKTHAVYYQLTEIKCFCSRNAGRFNFCGMNMLNEPLLLQPSDAKQASGWKKRFNQSNAMPFVNLSTLTVDIMLIQRLASLFHTACENPSP